MTAARADDFEGSDHPAASAAAADGGTGALFDSDEDGRFVPTGWARGPWSPDALHGGPVAALVARGAERHDGNERDGLQLVRITLELLRPVPMAPLGVETSVLKSGRRSQLVDLVVRTDEVEVAKARALRLRVAPDRGPITPSPSGEQPPLPPEECAPAPPPYDRYDAFHNRGVEMRFAAWNGPVPGPSTVWFRLRCPVVAGEEPTPWQTAAAVADFGNGISSELDFSTTTFVNADLTVSVHRPPAGPWVCLDARTRYGTPGIATTDSVLWDRQGRIGLAVQNLVVEPAPPAPSRRAPQAAPEGPT